MAKNIHKTIFSEQTKLKLGIFRECFREWFPVFLHNPYISNIFIYDLFAGSGTDVEGNYGSPLILLEEARGENGQHCKYLSKENKKVVFAYNEYQKRKVKTLGENIQTFFSDCKANCAEESCPYENNYHIKQSDFHELFQSTALLNNLANNKYGKFLLLDQYGFKHVDDEVFIRLTNSPKTDFIFFISSSTIRRFQESDVISKYLKDHKITFDAALPKECHRVIAKYFKSLIPKDKEYYIHHFTIQNQSNYYGLIFGSNHSFGMEKFLKVCWKYDILAGESNCNINNDFKKGELFYNPQETNKKEKVKILICSLVMSGRINNNKDGMRFALYNGCLPNIFVEVVEHLRDTKRINIVEGKFNKQVTGIHKIDEYKIIAL